MQDFLFNQTFWISLIQIVGIDIVLSGDNAVVIALAARSLPEAERRRAVIWGSSAAVLMRVTLTIVAAELLRLPLLKAAGALLLTWIAIQLLLPEDEGDGDGEAIKGGFLVAIKTIMLADLVMSMDNVVAIAGASKGSLLLLVLGLGLSIPLVVFSSTFLMKVMERFPVLVTAGAALLGFVAGEMLVSDLYLGPWIDSHAPLLHQLLPVAGALFVVLAGKMLAARMERRAAVELPLGEDAPESGAPR